MKFAKGKTVVGIVLIITTVVIVFSVLFKTNLKTDNLIYKEDFYNHQLKNEGGLLGKIFSFAENQLALVLDPLSDEIYISAKFHRQEHPVTCEVAALRMALNYLGENVTESELLKELNFDTVQPMTSDKVWGDPNLGFVGNVYGSVYDGTGYGVYEKPIQNLASKYRRSTIIEEADLSKIIKEVNKRNPVIVWGLLSDSKPLYWKTNEGKTIEAYPGEHARIVVGYSGDISNPSKIILMDPIYGKIKMSKEKFLEDWRKMNNKAVVIF